MLNRWECYTDRAQYVEEEKQEVMIIIETDTDWNMSEDNIQVKIYSLSKMMERITNLSWDLSGSKRCARVKSSMQQVGGYGVEVCCGNTVMCSTAFDIVVDYKDNLRYGFLSRFTEEDIDEEDVLYANKLHINMLQFYDWMYRHDKLVPDKERYQNPMGCDMSSKAIRRKINACSKYGIRPYAYGAVYAAGKDFYEDHKDWAMYKLDKTPIMFADWLVYMNIASGTGWNSYIKNQFKEAIEQFGFLGIHMDTYGYPKSGWDQEGNIINLAENFPLLINQTNEAVKEVNPKAGVIFNCVNNWPVDTVAGANQDGVYIEVWPPNNTYRDLTLLIQKAQQLSGRQVILAAYMKPFAGISSEEEHKKAEHACLLAFAVIHAAGGHQLVFGEKGGILCEGYYVNYTQMREEFLPVVRSYNDFIVRYSDLIYAKETMDISMTASDGINEDITFSCEETGIGFSSCGKADRIWCMIKEWSHYIGISMINLIGSDDQWNEKKSEIVIEIPNIKVRLLLEKEINGIYYSTPDDLNCEIHPLEYCIDHSNNGRFIEVTVPSLKVWDYLWIDCSEERE